MSTPFGSNASWRDCCYQYLLPPLHHAVWCAGTTARVAKQRTSLANPSRLNITFSFARLLITQLSPLIHCSTQLLEQQHRHKGRAAAEPKRGWRAEDRLKTSSTRERFTGIAAPTAKDTATRCNPVSSKTPATLILKSTSEQQIRVEQAVKHHLLFCCCYS